MVLKPDPTRSTDHRSLRVALLNLMPDKAATELQLSRLLAQPGFDVELDLLSPRTHTPKHTSAEHMESFYSAWDTHLTDGYDGLIVTGAPVETLDFEQVDYWSELTDVFEWAAQSVGCTLCICWAAQAALYHFHGVPKHLLDEKRFGVFTQAVAGAGKYLRGFGRCFDVPVSRHSEVRAADLANTGVKVLSESPESGLCLVEDEAHRLLCNFNHFEYDAHTLHAEYTRDLSAGKPIPLPKHYYDDDDPTQPAQNTWSHHGRRFFGNWLVEVEQRAESRLWAHRSALQRPSRFRSGAQASQQIFYRPGRRDQSCGKAQARFAQR